jgi:citrate synthase
MQASAPMPSGVHSDYVSSAEALAVLDVKPQTLYSYVSRGMIRRICADGKNCLYNREDISRLKARSTARSGHGAVAGGALQWGEPVLVTGITEITAQGPRYREHLALQLARAGHGYESVAEYLWTPGAIDPSVRWYSDESLLRIAPQVAALAAAYPRIQFRQLLTEIVLLLGIEHSQAHRETQPAFSLETARALVQALCMAFGFVGERNCFVAPRPQEDIAAYILRAYGIEAGPAEIRALNAAMVLLADHEFSPATFAARIAASSGVDLHSCIGAALHVHFGSALGLRCDRVERALQVAASAGGGKDHASLAHAGPVGFGHPLYAEGDPRASEILDLALGLSGHAAAARQALQTLQCIDDHEGAVSLDAALVVLCRALGLRGPVAGGLLAVSRSAGWIAHVIEQYQQDFMIRPRGKFASAPATTQLDLSERSSRARPSRAETRQRRNRGCPPFAKHLPA